MGRFKIDGTADRIFTNDEITRRHRIGALYGHQAQTDELEMSLEIESDSDISPLSALGGFAIIEEVGAAPVVCYDTDRVVILVLR